VRTGTGIVVCALLVNLLVIMVAAVADGRLRCKEFPYLDQACETVRGLAPIPSVALLRREPNRKREETS
jgi:hypothetical protein